MTDYEQSFQRMTDELSKIRVKPVPDIKFLSNVEERKANRSLQFSKEKPKIINISNRKRL